MCHHFTSHHLLTTDSRHAIVSIEKGAADRRSALSIQSYRMTAHLGLGAVISACYHFFLCGFRRRYSRDYLYQFDSRWQSRFRINWGSRSIHWAYPWFSPPFYAFRIMLRFFIHDLRRVAVPSVMFQGADRLPLLAAQYIYITLQDVVSTNYLYDGGRQAMVT